MFCCIKGRKHIIYNEKFIYQGSFTTHKQKKIFIVIKKSDVDDSKEGKHREYQLMSYGKKIIIFILKFIHMFLNKENFNALVFGQNQKL